MDPMAYFILVAMAPDYGGGWLLGGGGPLFSGGGGTYSVMPGLGGGGSGFNIGITYGGGETGLNFQFFSFGGGSSATYTLSIITLWSPAWNPCLLGCYYIPSMPAAFSPPTAQGPTFWDKILNYLKNNALYCGGSNVCTGGGLPGPVGAGAVAGEVAGAVSKSEKIAELTREAESAYPQLAAKVTDELHHIIPKYLGGAEKGETVALRPAYHQLITNAFRKLAPYGEKVERSAAELQQILRDVYSRYPLP